MLRFKPDQEFVADDLFEGTLIVEGTDPIAQVGNNAGHGQISGGDRDCHSTTRYGTTSGPVDRLWRRVFAGLSGRAIRGGQGRRITSTG